MYTLNFFRIILCAWQVSKALIKCWTMPKGPNIVFLDQALIWFWTKPTIVMQVSLRGSETVRSATDKAKDTRLIVSWLIVSYRQICSSYLCEKEYMMFILIDLKISLESRKQDWIIIIKNKYWLLQYQHPIFSSILFFNYFRLACCSTQMWIINSEPYATKLTALLEDQTSMKDWKNNNIKDTYISYID